MLFRSSNGYFENVWLWTADHELDQDDHSQIDIYNGRGMLVESQGPVWMYGTASEHSQMSQYQFSGAKDIFYGAIQTETPYYQPNPTASVPFTKNDKFFDPDMSQAKAAWAVRVTDGSESIWSYGAVPTRSSRTTIKTALLARTAKKTSMKLPTRATSTGSVSQQRPPST